MKVYTVYRADSRTSRTLRIGKVVDQRRTERSDNAEDMLRMARKLYATSSNPSGILIIRESPPLGLLVEKPASHR
jgi:hypothetical protein